MRNIDRLRDLGQGSVHARTTIPQATIAIFNISLDCQDNLLVTVSRDVSTAAEVSRDFRGGVDGALLSTSVARSDSIFLYIMI